MKKSTAMYIALMFWMFNLFNAGLYWISSPVNNNGGPRDNNFGMINTFQNASRIKVCDNDNNNNINLDATIDGNNNTISYMIYIVNNNFN